MKTPTTPPQPGRPRATVVDVARAAGVAVGTVSRVLNNHADVDSAIRARVLRAARDLSYTRIRRRRALPAAGGAGRGNIAVICFGMEDALVQLPVVSTALQGIENTLSQHGRSLVLANVPRGDRTPSCLQEGHVDGLILKGPNQGVLPAPEENELLRRVLRLPHVWLMGRPPNAHGDHCNFDPLVAGHLVVEHLHSRGHRLIGFLNPKTGQNQFERLKEGFLLAAQRLGCEPALLEMPPAPRLEWPLPAITLQENVDFLVERWASEPRKRRPTALFVPSDRTAVQLYSALARRGLRVGADVSIVSCNNERPVHAGLHPALTTVDVHAEAVGSRAVEQLLWRISHPQDSVPAQILLEPTLAVRDSVAVL